MVAFKWLTKSSVSQRTLFWGFLLFGSAAPSVVFAQAAPDDACHRDDACREHYQKAISAYKQESFDEALTEFKAAYDSRQMSILLVNIGRTLQKLGRPREAVAYYERFQKAETKLDPETGKKVQQYIGECRALIDDAPVAANGPPPPPPKPGKALLVTGGILAGVGVAGIVVGAALGGLTSSSFSDFGGTVDEFDKLAYRDRTRSYEIGATVSGIAGAALAGAGGTLIVLGILKNREALKEYDAKKTKTASTFRIVPSFSVSDRGFLGSVRGGF